MTSPPPKTIAIGQLIGAVAISVFAGMYLFQGVQNATRGDPSYWIQFPVALVGLAAVFILCRKILKAIP